MKGLIEMLKKLTERIYYMPNEQKGDRPLLGLIIGDKNSLIVDSGNSQKHAEEFLQEAAKLNIPPIKYVFLTHWHWDHVFGLNYMNFISICQKETNERLLEMQGFKWDDESLDYRVKIGKEIEFCSENIKHVIPNRDSFKVSSCDIIFDKSLEIDLGGVICTIENIGGNHTTDSSVLYVKEEKVLFMGDCLAEDLYNGPWSYCKEKLYPLIDKLKQYDSKYFLQSHCSPQDKVAMYEDFKMFNSIGDMIGEDIDFDKINIKFIDYFKRNPSDNEKYIINSFINGNKKI
jgi:glyoxylase-like metal-dependent hydrolase (beta-lactamase superfamily II)